MDRDIKGDVVPIFPLTAGPHYDRFTHMPRGPRLDTEGALHHVMVWGLEAHGIFLSNTDREDLVKRLTELSIQSNISFK